MNKESDINNKIIYLRERLNKQVEKNKGIICDKALIISQELDEIINEYIKYKNDDY